MRFSNCIFRGLRFSISITTIALLFLMKASAQPAQNASTIHLQALQQSFVDLKFGMFIHFNIPTFANQDWPDPDMSASLFNPTQLDCNQWADAAKSANMSYGCLTTKHHSGFCIWDTKTTDYNVMNSPLKKDVVREFADAFRKKGLKVMLYYSILDTHHRLRPNHINGDDVAYIKNQITELLTNYGPITALIIDGWDAPWSRISYSAVPFEEIYYLVKSLQPDCLLMDLNSAKYPGGTLFYSDIKSYEQNAGQRISKETNQLPALSCYPLQSSWFWKTDFPATPVKDPEKLVQNDLIPLNKAYCNYILNVAPNRDGLIDDNALAALKKMGAIWHDDNHYEQLPKQVAPIVSSNLAIDQFAESSWSDDMNIMDFGNDDNYHTAWVSNPKVKQPWYQVNLGQNKPINAIAITEGDGKPSIKKYRIEYFIDGNWHELLKGADQSRTKLHRFKTIWASRVRMDIDAFDGNPQIAEFGVYNERR